VGNGMEFRNERKKGAKNPVKKRGPYCAKRGCGCHVDMPCGGAKPESRKRMAI